MPKVDHKQRIKQEQTAGSYEFDTEVSLIQAFIPIGLMAVEELLYKEVELLAGPPNHRKDKGGFPGYRWGSNPGSVFLGDTKARVAVPRVRNRQTEKEIPLKSYQLLKDKRHIRQQLMGRLLGGLSLRRYSECASLLPEVFGISASSLSRHFMEETETKLKAFTARRLTADYVALFIDGKTFARQQIIIALGVTMAGNKIPVGFIQGTTEHHRVCMDLLNDLKDRGFLSSEGLLVIIDGSKGLYKAVNEVFSNTVMVQRCQWHKRENVLSYLPKNKKPEYKQKIQEAYNSDTYNEAKNKLEAIVNELKGINLSAARSLGEGLAETLTLHKLKLPPELHTAFKTTNCIESLNSQIARLTGRVTRWHSSKQIHRWVASALLDIEMRMRKIRGYEKLNKLRTAIQKELKLNQSQIS
ncbi:MAG: IS256 family transposase [Fidelibacterota bacterium]